MSEMKPYIVRQGDYVDKIAFVEGFDAKDVWTHDKNEPLHSSGRTYDLLCPGDLLALPSEPRRPCSIALSTENRYSCVVPATAVAVIIRELGEPLVNEPCMVYGPDGEVQRETDSQGAIEIHMPISAAFLEVYVPRLDRCLRVEVGFLDPITSTSGMVQRLANLGFTSSSVRTGEEADLRGVLERFQAAHELPITGSFDDATRSKLTTAHTS